MKKTKIIFLLSDRNLYVHEEKITQYNILFQF